MQQQQQHQQKQQQRQQEQHDLLLPEFATLAMAEDTDVTDLSSSGPTSTSVDAKARKSRAKAVHLRAPKPPKVAGQPVHFSGDKSVNLDIITRDPRQINDHCRVQFEDIIAEPDPSVFSFDGVWTVSYKVFSTTKLWCYRLTSLLCAVPAALCWGIEFACLSFCTIWCWQPHLKAYEISLWYSRRIFEIVLAVFLEPCCNTIGKCLSHITVTVKHDN